MKPSIDRENATGNADPRPSARALTLFHAALKFPFTLVATLLKRAAQILLSILILILHPRFRWLLRLLTRSHLVRNIIAPAIRKLIADYYEPYFTFLRRLPPYWATFSIALPLAALEPAKVYATILIAQHPRAGIVLWTFLQGLGFVLIDKTWTAVRPQSRKIWIVSRLHAWGWVNVAYGKYWITSSSFYQAALHRLRQLRMAAQALWLQLSARRRRGL